jgi:hypothetical protein
MRPKFSVWSDHGASAQKHWMLTSKRGTHTSIGPKILLAAVSVVASVIGLSGIYPKVIDAQGVQDAPTHCPCLHRQRSGRALSLQFRYRRVAPSRRARPRSRRRVPRQNWRNCALRLPP